MSEIGIGMKAVCDKCGFDLTFTGNSEDWRLVLTYESKGVRPGAVALTDMAIAPPVDRTYLFCGVGCLAAWLKAEKPNALNDFDRLLKRRERFAKR